MYVKASFEACSAERVWSRLQADGWDCVVGGRDDSGSFVIVCQPDGTMADGDSLKQTIWEMNGGCMCELSYPTEDEVDDYL